MRPTSQAVSLFWRFASNRRVAALEHVCKFVKDEPELLWREFGEPDQ